MNRRDALLMLIMLLTLDVMPQAAAQGTYKCKDAAGKITYAGQECDKLGLSSAGEIKDKSNVAPAYKAPPAAARPAPAAESNAPPAPAQGNAEASGDPKRRCFTVKTAKGTATRCNEEPSKE